MLAIVLGRSVASEGWVFLPSPGSHGPLEQALEIVALHCTIDLLSAWTDWNKCGARAKVSLQTGGWIQEL